MENLYLLCLSDIHFNKNEPEGQGLVLNEFFKDLSKVLSDIDHENLYCVISGDLVQAGNVEQAYNEFSRYFLKKLQQYVPLKNILVVAGNHDLNRNILMQDNWKQLQNDLVNSKEEEEKYNETLRDNADSVIYKKFFQFNQFVNKELQIPSYDLFGYAVNIVPEISVYCLNSSLLSNGGQEGFAKDIGNLRIETSGLYRWAQENEGRTKILVMHHPLYHLTEYAQSIVENNVRKHIDIVITGHLHKQDVKQYLGREDGTIKYCSSPQLYSEKQAPNGYSLIRFTNNQIESITYRKWSPLIEEFTEGNEFSRTPDGIIRFKREQKNREDVVEKELELALNQSLRAYNYIPSWVDRVVSNVAPGLSAKKEDIIIWDHISVINAKENVQIVGGAQFGLTSFARKIILEAWRIKKEHWLYVEGMHLRLSKVQNIIDDFISARGISVEDINAFVIDDWNKTLDDRQKILNKIRRINPEVRLILINNEEDTQFFAGLNNNLYEADFQLLYLRELSRKGVRQLSKEFITKQHFTTDNSGKLLERLIEQLLDLNVHRTPINCLQLLLNFQQNYDAHPVDRTKILKSLIMFFFLKPDSYFYTDAIDESDCCEIMGKLCEALMRSSDEKTYQRYFSEDQYLNATESLNGKYTRDMRLKLFKAMLDAQIIVPYLNLYEFRFCYWVYFFAAYQMYIDRKFYDYMMDSVKCIYMPDIIEFYTGIDPKCDDLITRMTNELLALSNDVVTTFAPNEKDPYASMKFRQNPILDNKTQEQLEERIKASKLPDELKDAIMEQHDDNTKPYFQMISTVLEQYKVQNLMSLSRSASRAMRNSLHIKEENRSLLYGSIQVSWMAILNVLQVLTPMMARTGYGKLGGACFRLAGDFPEDVNKRTIAVLTSLPFNVIDWFRNDVYSEKRYPIYKELINNPKVPSISRHMNVLLLVRCRPNGWQELVGKYIDEVGRNSFYIADVKNMLNYCYRIEEMSPKDERYTGKLILSAIEKMRKHYVDPNKDKYFNTSQRSNAELLPKREANE